MDERDDDLQAAAELVTGLGAAKPSRGVPLIAPARSNVPPMLTTPITSRTYSPYGAAQPASTLTARQALVNARRSMAVNATDAGGHIYGRPALPPPQYPQRPVGSKKQYGVGGSVSSMNLARPLVPAVRAAMRAGGITPNALTAAQSLARSLMQQAMPANQFGMPSAQAGATWARMKQGAQLAIGPGSNVPVGVFAQAGEQVAAAANAVNVGGYSNYYRQIWVKRGQTFDASSWKTGWVHESVLSISNVPAQWGQQGFGAVDQGLGPLIDMVARALTTQPPGAPRAPSLRSTIASRTQAPGPSPSAHIIKFDVVAPDPPSQQPPEPWHADDVPKHLHGRAHRPASSRFFAGLPEDQMNELEVAVGLAAGGGGGQQQLGPKTVYVDGPFTLIDAQRVLLAGTINGEKVQGTFSGPGVNFHANVPYWVRGYVTRHPATGLQPAYYTGNVTVHIGQKTQVNMWMEMLVVSPYASPLPPIEGRPTWGLPPPPKAPVSRMVGSRMMSFAGLPEDQMDEEMEFATGLGAAMAMSSMATHRALSPTSGSSSAPACQPGYHLEWRTFVDPGPPHTDPTIPYPPPVARKRLECVPNPSPYGAAPGGSPLTASMALRRAIMSQASPADQRRSPPWRPPPYQVSHIGAHGLPPEMEFAAGLGAMMVAGFGALGPFGNASTLNPDEYQITGDGVYMWNGPQSNAGSISDANGKSIFLNTGDRVTASGTVTLDVGNGKYYAKVLSDKAPNEPEIWVAVEYLAPLAWQKPAAPVTPTAPPKPAQPPNAMLPAGKTDYTVPILVGAGVVGAGLIGYALYRRKKGHRRAA